MFAKSDTEIELLENAKRAKSECEDLLGKRKYDEALRSMMICIDTLAQLSGWIDGTIKSKSDAKKQNQKRFVEFLWSKTPKNGGNIDWDYTVDCDGKTVSIDVAEVAYQIRCKQVHEYSNLTSQNFPIKISWLYVPGTLFEVGRNPDNSIHVYVSGLLILQTLWTISETTISIYSSTEEHMHFTAGDPFFVLRKIGIVKRQDISLEKKN